MVRETILCSGEAFGHQTLDSTRSTQRDYVCQGKVGSMHTACLDVEAQDTDWVLFQVYPPAPRNVLTILQPKLLMFSMGKR